MHVCHSQNKENNLKRIIRVGSQPQELWEMNQFDYNVKNKFVWNNSRCDVGIKDNCEKL